ncbi:c-type cytochrome [Phenylobacterium aquaticum]|uniref:c-type cytochrome n=1 Tax=Phenylobacterium aquaticum TaxID=1763816 RepID=UPI001F5D73BB|nr:c-type cytochrome [Phenylobacterium aquaticum]
MNAPRRLAVLIFALALGACSPQKAEPLKAKAPAGPPPALAWAYPDAPEAPLPDYPPGPQHLPGIDRVVSSAELNDPAHPVDWTPDRHPAPPAVVGHRRPGGPAPCAECHFYNGVGFVGAADLAGLPAGYITQQLAEFRSGRRVSSQRANRPDTEEMIAVAKGLTEAEAAQAAAYYASLPRRPFVRVVETDVAPAARANHWGWQELIPDAPPQPLNGGVVEVAEDWPRMLLRDPRTGVVAYVPRGAIARGEALVRTGGPAAQPCASCHGADLKGREGVPPLAGRSPAYLVRMLWDIKSGARSGPAVAQMLVPVSDLTPAQIIDIAAYLGSRTP